MNILNRTITGMLIFALVIFSSGCAYTSKEQNFNPVAANGWKRLWDSSLKKPRLYYDCAIFKVEAHFISIENTTKSIGVILPIIPVFEKGSGTLSEHTLRVEIILEGTLADVSLSEKSLSIIIDKEEKNLCPVSYELNYGQPKIREYYNFIFNVNPLNIKSFMLIFNESISGCTIPPLKYEYKDLGLEYNIISN